MNWKGFLNGRICGGLKLLHKGRLAEPAWQLPPKSRIGAGGIHKKYEAAATGQPGKIVIDFIQEPEARAG
ncbi:MULTISPECIES: hypothetical protein [Bacillaceae]|uniref:hypothetical protein n=1 Tax=Bacillaceae TaxID=186817 RepID=UPI000B9B9B7E|nr:MULTISPECIES: hypothetical protein [Bacillus]OXT16059.1 hypothetical protein B9K06_17980 [Bacillus sp. OG2]MCA1033431.1 hypothetical protein [Bacillus infantis]MCK6206658.1 hypothetical protein [Bacillus infantis]MCP1160757.1 hypothetical protein [Bacillus infantis]MDW2876387.1 hypothetical protein [Bacillus infantis]